MINSTKTYDVIIIGGGHAGTEAALASARIGAKTLLLSHNIETLGQMSCNPAIGGIGKGHLVKEIDALGGIMAEAADHAGIHFRTLNASKGPAVRATRAQADRALYKSFVRATLENQDNLTIFQQGVNDILMEGDRVTGVATQMGLKFYAPAIVLTAGTFLGGKMHVGLQQYAGGRAGDSNASTLAERLRDLNLRVNRLKTGTPPRLDGKTIDFSVLTKQPGDTPRPVFSFLGSTDQHPQQVNCHITHTNEKTHDIIRANTDKSPIYTGVIEGLGPRYCPSIEDKIVRFADKNSHQVFVEPEGLNTNEIYPNGISTSMPYDVQIAFIQSMKGFENAHITRPGYAVEYDFFDPRDLKPSLETKAIEGLFFAGQINGTTGYEEAAAQGLIAGLNAARKTKSLDAWTPRRDEGYIGVLIDDLITRGTMEPYRMFTSRAEYRLMLREDNADRRLTAIGRELGLVNDSRWDAYSRKEDLIKSESERLAKLLVRPGTPAGNAINERIEKPLPREYHLTDILRRPEIHYADLMAIEAFGPGIDHQAAAEQIEISLKYAGYIDRQVDEVAKRQHQEALKLSESLNYDNVVGLSSEVRQKLNVAKPANIGMASRLPGMTPAAISILLVHLKRNNKLAG